MLFRSFTDGDDGGLDILRISREQEARQRDRLTSVRRARSDDAVRDARERLAREAADRTANLMPALIDASRAMVTLGEMMSTLGGVFGRHVEVPTI